MESNAETRSAQSVRTLVFYGLAAVPLLVLFAPAQSYARFPDFLGAPPQFTDDRPGLIFAIHNFSECRCQVYNSGFFGWPFSDVYPSLRWPADEVNDHLQLGGLWAACYGPVTVWPDSVSKWVSSIHWYDWELKCSEGCVLEYAYPGAIGLEQSSFTFDDWYPSMNDNPFGFQVYQENYSWATPGYDDFIASSYWITHHTGLLEPDVVVPAGPLTGLMVAVFADFDVSSADESQNYLDDMVFYDGHAIWCNDPLAPFEYVFDNGNGASVDDRFTYALNPLLGEDSVYFYYNYPGEDGIPDADADQNGVSDHFTILAKVVGSDTVYAEEPYTGFLLFSDGMPQNHWHHTVGDTTYLVVPRNMTYAWDSDNPATPSDDSGEPDVDPHCDGVVGWRLIDFWVKRADGTIERPIDVFDYPIPLSNTWWNWEGYPESDIEKYDYMAGLNPQASGWYSGPTYLSEWVWSPSAPEAFEPMNPGPFPIVNELPYGLGYPVTDYRNLITMGYVDLYEGDTLRIIGGWVVGKGLDGARQVADRLLDAYYRGGGWGIPNLPPEPILFYEAGDHVVDLQWASNAESYSPFGGYRIYRSQFEPEEWQLVVEIPGTSTHVYADTTVTNGFPYFYTVTAYDAETGVEGIRSNYKKTLQGDPLGVVPCWAAESGLENVGVVPNPYRGSASWEETFADKMAFTGLPAVCNIHIYTLGGDHVITLEHRSYGDSGTEFWNLRSRNDQEIATGLYVYCVESDEDYCFGKFAIIR